MDRSQEPEVVGDHRKQVYTHSRPVSQRSHCDMTACTRLEKLKPNEVPSRREDVDTGEPSIPS